MRNTQEQSNKQITSSKPIPHIPLPFKEVMADVLKVKAPARKRPRQKKSK